MDDSTLLTLAPGPTSSLILLLGMGLGLYRFFVHMIVPAVKAYVERHLASVDRMLDEHAKDREAWLSTMSKAQEQQDRIERKVGGLYARFDALKDAS
jgi:hypothetical protein